VLLGGAGDDVELGVGAAQPPSHPRLLVLDEPFEAVDPVSAATIRTILQRFVAAGGSVVFRSRDAAGGAAL
jgi:ABC-type multidrug transport system ATPase subunit